MARPPTLDLSSLRTELRSSVEAIISASARLATQDLSFQRTANLSVANRLDDNSARLLRLSSEILDSAGKALGQPVPATLEDADDIDIHWRGVVDMVDTLLEKADICLDEYTGLLRRKGGGGHAKTDLEPAKQAKPTNVFLESSMRRAQIAKPQDLFERKPNNFDIEPWKPLLTAKPHAIVPLNKSLEMFLDGEGSKQYKHPYESEIISMSYPDRVRQAAEPIKYLPIDTTSAKFVDTYEGVLEMLDELKQAREIAIDLEHHDYRSYTGLLSLMQISTRGKDWIVDTLQPWRHRLEILNQVLADPNIVKVLHGAFMDIIWLQRDLGLYIVGLFDTHYASEALAYPSKSLSYLLKRFAEVDAEKQYQMADWRIRPLPEKMAWYARCDTHYLLYIYDILRNLLVEKSSMPQSGEDMMSQVLRKSKEVSLQSYQALTSDGDTGFGARGWFNALTSNQYFKFLHLNGEQFSVYKAVHQWRDSLARREDESPYYFLPNVMAAEIVKIMPTSMQELVRILRAKPQVFNILKPHLNDLLYVIQEAKSRGVDGPSVMDFFRGRPPCLRGAKIASAASIHEMPWTEGGRSEKSQLWGSVPVSTRWEGRSLAARERASKVMAPLYMSYLVPKVTVVAGVAKTRDSPARFPNAISDLGGAEIIPIDVEPLQRAPLDAGDAEFTLKAGRKRKNPLLEDSESESEPEEVVLPGSGLPPAGTTKGTENLRPAVEDEEEDGEVVQDGAAKIQKPLSKQERRRRHRQERKKLQGRPNMGGKVAAAEADEEMFDYSKAPSVLHSQPRPSGKTPWNPNAASRTSGGPQGARRSRNFPKAHKSMTIRR